MTGMDLGAGPSYLVGMIRIVTSNRYRKIAGFPQDSARPRALARHR